MIDFNLIQDLKQNQTSPVEGTIANPYEGLSTAAADLHIREEQRIEKAAVREAAIEEIAVKAVSSTLAQAEAIADKVEPMYHRKPRVVKNDGGSIMIQLSDLHFGATVEGLEGRKKGNVYNLEVASLRLAALAEQAIFYACAHHADELVIALTGDIFDSRIGKERKDKMFNSEATACQAYLHGRDYLFQFIEHLRETELFEKIRIVGISGNEARLYADRGHSHIMASDNWDSLLNADLASRYRGTDVKCEFGVNRYVLEVQGWKCLLIHGDQVLDQNLSQKTVQSLLGLLEADFGISGHIHDTRVTSKWIRSACLVGADYYAGDGLALESRAQQNIFWMVEGRRNTYVVDLQDPPKGTVPYELFDYNGSFGNASLT